MSSAAESDDEDTGRREQILSAALEVFSENGYHRASMRQIARQADLKSPAHLYFYFDGKADLYAQVLQSSVPAGQDLWFAEVELDGPPERTLTRIARAYLRFFESDTTSRLFRMFLAEAATEPEVGTEYMRTANQNYLSLLQDHLDAQIEAGRIRSCDTRATAIWFLWQLISYVELRELFAPLYEDLPPPDEYVDHIVDVAVNGLKRRPPAG